MHARALFCKSCHWCFSHSSTLCWSAGPCAELIDGHNVRTTCLHAMVVDACRWCATAGQHAGSTQQDERSESVPCDADNSIMTACSAQRPSIWTQLYMPCMKHAMCHALLYSGKRIFGCARILMVAWNPVPKKVAARALHQSCAQGSTCCTTTKRQRTP